MERPNVVAELKNVSVAYGTIENELHALRNVCLTVSCGEILLVMGPSGSGKSTMLQVLGCMRQPSYGTVFIKGMSVRGLSQDELSRLRSRTIGFVFQHYNLLANLRAWENVALALEIRNAESRGIEEESRLLLRRLGVEMREDAYPEELSGGEKQRVAIARAVAGRPDLILADEPTAALDAENGAQVAHLLAEIAHENDCAIVLVTHDQRISGVADRIVHLEDGMIRSQPVGKTLPKERSERSGIDEIENYVTGSAQFGGVRRAALARWVR